MGDDNIQKGKAVVGKMGDFAWAITANKGPSLQISNDAPVAAFKAGSLRVVRTRLNTGTACKYTWLADGKPIGGSNNLPAFEADSYARPGVPQGKLTGRIEVPSKIYPGVKSQCLVLCARAVGRRDAARRPDMGDGQNFTGPWPGQWRVLETLDDLRAQKRIP